ncbi:MAG TPA: U32 family peptidase [Geopsychrobacteraceae bacterium]|nr:U32 family peptidase [Geopsychrobacteraceae bacterium]
MNVEKKYELLVPAGDLEKLKTAIRFGADAIYLGGSTFGLRANAGNFSMEELRQARELTTRAEVKLYLTLNASLQPGEFGPLSEFLEDLRALDLDAYIVSDPGVLAQVRQVDPQRNIHISTQANTCNPVAAEFWRKNGANRINLARELTLKDIQAFSTGTEVELECFVHGAMCVAHSGRCLLSAALLDRSANKGDCAQPCRWNYSLVEEMRPGEMMNFEEDERGSYVFNSRDLCLIEQLPLLAAAGVSSFKIEGRMKSIYYVAATTRIYRAALDRLLAADDSYDPRWREELEMVSHRPYDTGFLFGRKDARIHPENTQYVRTHDYIGVVRSGDDGLFIEGRNRFLPGDEIELIGPAMRQQSFRLERIVDLKGNELPVSQPNAQVRLALPDWAEPGDLLRRARVQS